MAVTLDNTLLTAQTALVRRPLVELKSVQSSSSIPFQGTPFNYNTTDEDKSALLYHSTGILVSIWARSGSLIINYSDSDKITWTEVTLYTYSGDITSLDICEKSDGNIGIVYVRVFSGTEYITQATVNSSGSVVSAASTISSYNSDYDINGISLELMNNGSYIISYSKYDESVSPDYGLYTRTSNDFSSWAAESEVTTGFTATYGHYGTNIFQSDKDNDVILTVSYANEVRDVATEKVNLYFLVSSNYGTTWSSATKITGLEAWGEKALQPAMDEDSSYNISIAYNYLTSALHIDKDADLWISDCEGTGSADYSTATRLFFDQDRKYLYSFNRYIYVGSKILCSITVIDVNNWVVHRNYSTTTTPAYDDIYLNDNISYYTFHADGKYISFGYSGLITVIDDEEETLTNYCFRDTGNVSANLDNFDPHDEWSIVGTTLNVECTKIDEENNRLYILLTDGASVVHGFVVGYIDLTESPSLGLYTWHEIVATNSWPTLTMTGLHEMIILPDQDIVIVSSRTQIPDWAGRTDLYKISTGDLIKTYSYSNNIGYPYQGIDNIIHYNGYLYGSFNYNSGYGQENYRGMVRIDLESESITYLQPSYETKNSYDLEFKKVTLEGLIIIGAQGDGVVTYEISSGTWIRYNPSDYPDIYLGATETLDFSVAYNEDDNIIYAGNPSLPSLVYDLPGIRAFYLGGSLKRIKYLILSKSGGSWSAGDEADLVSGNQENEPYPAYLPDDTLWVSWTRGNDETQEKSIYYDNTVAELDITPYLTEDGVTVNKSVKTTGKLSFSVSHGHLFDQNNTGSSLTRFLKKGRPITLRFGELIDGIEYWSTQGTFYVDTFKLSYKRGTYPVASITCIDRVALLKFAQTVASAYFSSQYPEEIINSLLIDHTNLTSAEIDLGSFTNRHLIDYQVVDEKLLEAMEEILDHFGVVLYASTDNKITTKEIKFTGSADNTYSDASKIIEFTPDDNFSDYTNRVTVNGEGLNPIEVLYDEELLTNYNGTGGWWETGSEERTIYYSEDREKKARNARLNVVKSIGDFEILWQESNGKEYLSGEDENGYYCTLIIEFPGLMAVLIALIAAVIALGVAAVGCDWGNYCGGMLMAFSVLISAVSYLLGQVATYEYEIWGRPFGEELQQYSASADDTELQEFLDDLVIEETIEDPFCYTESECQRVADYEMNVVKAQRRRISFSKIAHIQDEPGDILQVTHPYSRTSLNVFVTDVSRTFKRGTVTKKNGTFTDKISGWRLE